MRMPNFFFAPIFLFSLNLLGLSGCLPIQPQDSRCSPATSQMFAKTVHITESLYPAFILESFGRTTTTSIEDLQICIISHEEINDPAQFSPHPGGVVGRYLPIAERIYITPIGITRHNTDLAHELVHHFNAQNGFTEKQVDEAIAYEFERRFEANY